MGSAALTAYSLGGSVDRNQRASNAQYPLPPVCEVNELALELAHRYQRSYYDSAYLALAQQLGVWCFTGDKRLYNALSRQLDWLRWIGDYRLESLP